MYFSNSPFLSFVMNGGLEKIMYKKRKICVCISAAASFYIRFGRLCAPDYVEILGAKVFFFTQLEVWNSAQGAAGVFAENKATELVETKAYEARGDGGNRMVTMDDSHPTMV